MTKSTKSAKVPKACQALYENLTSITDAVCRDRLTEEYAELARFAVAALCRKRPNPLQSGRPEGWACAVVYAIAQVNFLYDRDSEPSMPMAELCALFGVAPSTGGNKAKLVRAALGIGRWDHRWTLPSRLATTGMLWLVEVDGFCVDARGLPLGLQRIAHEKGLIPYVPGDAEGSPRASVVAR